MQSSNLAARMEAVAPDLNSLERPALKVITQPEASVTRRGAPRLSFTARRIVTRDNGYRMFRVF